MDENEKKARQEAKESLERIQKFDASTLSRSDDLGKEFEFASTIEPVKKCIAFFEQLQVGILDELPLRHVRIIKRETDVLYKLFQRILDFGASQNDTLDTRLNILNQVNAYYEKLFNALHHYISYAVSSSINFKSLEKEGRTVVQDAKDKTNELIEKMNTCDRQSEEILKKVRKSAAEQGVSQQAHHFKTEAEEQEKKAEQWRKTTVKLAITLGIYGGIAIFIHKIPFIAPENSYESVQLIASKIVIFFVLTYILSLSVKNFLSHKHNALVNKHRQNSLMTFTALVEAAGGEDTRDIILNHAASCIFAQQETGYIKGSANSSDISSKTIIETLPKSTIRVDGST